MTRLLAEGQNHPVLIEEIRWKTFVEENKACLEDNNLEMTRSYVNSFSRTIRESIPGLGIHNIGRPDEIPAGVLARAGVYRMKNYKNIELFMNSNSRCTILKLDDLSSDIDRLTKRVCVFFWEFLEKPIAEMRMVESTPLFKGQYPVTNNIYVVGYGKPTIEHIMLISSVNWKIFRSNFGHVPSLDWDSSQPLRIINRLWRIYGERAVEAWGHTKGEHRSLIRNMILANDTEGVWKWIYEFENNVKRSEITSYEFD